MPEFSTPFSVKKNDKKLTKEELIRAIRFSIAAEYEAIQLYEEIEESIDNESAIKILKEVTEDEKVHVGNFLHLLKLIAPDDKDFYEEGNSEAKEILSEN